ncbi:LacI family DNA-binding transcriptional regulator [Microbacterium sorbitolivorans]|uniref:LacI family transcriptional regulator n=1 Tax=Microbacterium sorbitolivorans TaxID=1867410 RepID=A0A367XY08_9MICO|nr:LacI family DNA-binding transcriptional regulator [Microbacterium sorbitolivorans]RCK58507.1 LacI family transcriptional regulator [Microbacterium sorbitolivorans]
MTSSTVKRAATLHDVAQEAGVSLATASRVLNGSTRKVADSYRERVEAAAALLGYSANFSAQATARGSSQAIALLVANIADSYFSQVAAGIAHAAEEHNLVMSIGITERSPEREARLIRSLRGQRPSGIVLAASRRTAESSPALAQALADLENDGVRVVTLGSPADGVTSRTVGIANREGTHELGQTLAGLGYREAIVLAADVGLITSDDRVAGFVSGFTAGGGSEPRILRDELTRDAGYALMARALEEGVAPGTVVFGASDVVAFGAMSAVRDAGREVGSDIAIAGFGDIDTGRDIVPSLTTVRAPLDELGRQAVAAVMADDWTDPDPLPVDVIVRDSTPGR